MKNSLLLVLLLLSVVTANTNNDAPPNNTKKVMNHSAEISTSPSTDSPFKNWIHPTEIKTGAPTTKKSKQVPKMPKLLPISTDCFDSIPGTPTWNNCLRKFQDDIAENRKRMEEMNAVVAKMSQSHDSFLSKTSSTSGGYSIYTENVKASTEVTKKDFRMTLFVNYHIRYLKIVKAGRVFKISGYHNGQRIFAEIHIPNTVKVDEIMVARQGQTIVISGPVR